MDHEASAPNQNLVLATDRALVLASERSLAVTASLQEDAEREAFKAFLRRHPQFLIDGLSQVYPLNADILSGHEDVWNWSGLSRNWHLPWSDELIERHIERWDWVQLSGNSGLPWSVDLIERYIDLWEWYFL